MEGEFLGDPFATQTAETAQLCQLCERRGHTAKNCPTLTGEKEQPEQRQEKQGKQQLWRIVSDGKRYLTTDESGDVVLSKQISPHGWEEWELTRTEQSGGEPILTMRSHKSGGYLFAYQGNKSKVSCQKNVNEDAPEIYFTMEKVAKKGGLLKKGGGEGRCLRTHHRTYLKDGGKKVECSDKHPEKDKHLHWHLFEVLVNAERRKEVWEFSQVFHVPDGEDYSNPHLPVLTLDHDVGFQLSEKMFAGGNADITGPDGRIWFRVGKVAGFRTSVDQAGRIGINNSKGEPLVLLQDQSKPGLLKYAIARVLKTDAGLKAVPRAAIERTEQMFGANYSIFLHDGRSIPFSGSISDFKTTFKDPSTNEVACTVSRKLSISKGCYTITVKHDEDVMLYLAFAVAIDKMHHQAAQGGANMDYSYFSTNLWSTHCSFFSSGTKCNACGLTQCLCFML